MGISWIRDGRHLKLSSTNDLSLIAHCLCPLYKEIVDLPSLKLCTSFNIRLTYLWCLFVAQYVLLLDVSRFQPKCKKDNKSAELVHIRLFNITLGLTSTMSLSACQIDSLY